MKTSIIYISVIAIYISGIIVISCQSSTTRVEIAKNRLETAKANEKEAALKLIEAKNDSISDYQEFKKEAEKRIKTNENEIAGVKAKLSNVPVDEQRKIEKELADFEYKNNELKMKLENSKEFGVNKWELVQVEFTNNLDDLTQSIKKFTKKVSDKIADLSTSM